MNNLEIYDRVKSVPESAKKPIKGGRLKGMTDINPMWRIKTLTEIFGACGFGWKYEITDSQIVDGANGEKAAFVDIDFYYKWNGEWSEAIPGTGGSSFVSKESGGLYTSDECFKKALTDAISVAAKAIGIGADVYWDRDKTKYSKEETTNVASKDTQKKDTTYDDTKKKVEELIDEFVLMTNRSDEEIINEALKSLNIDKPYEALTLEELKKVGGKLKGWISKKREQMSGNDGA